MRGGKSRLALQISLKTGMTVMGHQSFFETEKNPQTRMNTKKNVPDSKIRHIIWKGWTL